MRTRVDVREMLDSSRFGAHQWAIVALCAARLVMDGFAGEYGPRRIRVSLMRIVSCGRERLTRSLRQASRRPGHGAGRGCDVDALAGRERLATNGGRDGRTSRRIPAGRSCARVVGARRAQAHAGLLHPGLAKAARTS